MIDAYCGIATIGLYLSKEANDIYGVEVIEDAIIDAKLNGFNNAYYEVGEEKNEVALNKINNESSKYKYINTVIECKRREYQLNELNDLVDNNK